VSQLKTPFRWKRLQIADRRPLVRLTADARRWDVRLVGLLSRNRLLVTHPLKDGKLMFVREGERFDVTNFDGAVVSTFPSTVLRVVLGDAPGLEMSLPPMEQRRRETIRRTRRAPVTLPCSLRYGDGEGAVRAGLTGDLSDQGALVAIAQPLPDGTEEVELSLKFGVLGEQQTVAVRARVRSMAPDPRPDMPATLVGLQFEALPHPTRLAIGLFVAERLLAEADDVFGAIR
jgi:c-di-GMP-binding flagellar brake protein YcgR